MIFFRLNMLAAALILLLGGCGDSGNASGGAGDGKAVVSEASGAGESLPGDLPKDVPLYSGTVYTVSDSEAGEWGFTFETPDTKEQIKTKLKEMLSRDGWAVTSDIDLGKAGGQYKASNKKYNVRVSYTANPTTREAEVPTYMVAYKVESAG